MKVELFNLPYFSFILLNILFIVGMYFLLRKATLKTKKIVLAIILFFNLALHFLKLLFPPYSTDPDKAVRDVWFINVCATSVLFFPFLFLSKADGAKDYIFYLGVISGAIALVYPTEALGNYVWTWDLWRFYICHGIIFSIPLLMVILKVHTLNYRRIWKMPLYIFATLMFITVNQALSSELGFTELRGNDIFDNPYRNNSLIWGPTDDTAIMFSIFTPNFMKTIPYGDMIGMEKYWPLFWMMPGIIVYFWILPFAISMIWEHKHFAADIKRLFSKKQKVQQLKLKI